MELFTPFRIKCRRCLNAYSAPIAPPTQHLSYGHKVENGAFRILKAQIRTEAPKGNSRCAKRSLSGGRIRNTQRHVMRLAQGLVARGLKQRQTGAALPQPAQKTEEHQPDTQPP